MTSRTFRRATAAAAVAFATVAASACADEPDVVPDNDAPAGTATAQGQEEQYFADAEYLGETVTVTRRSRRT